MGQWRYCSGLIAALTIAPVGGGAVHAQNPACPALTAIRVDSAAAAALRPDVVIRASATAASLTFNGQPRADVQFRGCGLRDTVHVLERTNLPSPVVSGTTYRNVKIAVEILAFLDVDCILAQLGAPGSVRDSTGAVTIPECRRNR